MGFEISMCAVVIMANGAKVNTNNSLLLFADNMKTKIPIKNDAIIFLYVECIINGLLDKEENIEIIKNNATVQYIEKAAF